MRYRPEEIERFGLVAYAVYGGYVYSFKCPGVSGDRVYDADLLEPIFKAASDRADELIKQRNIS